MFKIFFTAFVFSALQSTSNSPSHISLFTVSFHDRCDTILPAKEGGKETSKQARTSSINSKLTGRAMLWVLSKKIVRVREWLLSIDMKTKVVQHVKSDWMRDWMSVRVRKSEIVRESEKRKKTLKNFQVPSFCLTFRHFLAGNQLYEL